ncbi:HAMP domain-containing sensor histidine kinase [Streptomyces sp. NPDC005706]|uniref:sensor histidine kinase n=1 Tax=Streptomyces sp. NPDC005706 TaxID=3157169 RepID=UPI0033F7D56B
MGNPGRPDDPASAAQLPRSGDSRPGRAGAPARLDLRARGGLPRLPERGARRLDARRGHRGEHRGGQPGRLARCRGRLRHPHRRPRRRHRPAGRRPGRLRPVRPKIIDRGPGMAEADRARAFDRFWRAAGSHHDGTGLGLPIVRHLVQASGGDITLHSAPGTGLDAAVRLRPVADGLSRHSSGHPRSRPASVTAP